MREPPLLHGSVVDSGVVVLLTPVYEASADAGSFTLREEATSSRHSPAALSSASWGSASRVWRSPTLHIGSFVVTPSTQRLVSGMLLVPAVMISIWYAPQEAVMLLGSIATTVASYEFAWLAFRFARRVERLFSYYEQPARSVQEEQRSIHLSRGNSDSEEGSWSFSSGDVDPHAGVVAPIAGVLFYRGNQWLAALVLALPTSMILVGIDGKVLDLVRPTDHNLETFVWAYLVPTRYVAALCGWFAPSWSWTVLILWQSEVFSVMAVLVQSCPIAVFTCTSTANSNYLFTVFVVGCVAMLLFCASTSSDRMLVVHAALAVTGFVFVHGLGLSMVSLLDVSDLERSRAILTLLLTIFWSAQTSAWV
ncbi:hypothetical protein PHYPSEUDO_010234 [Phytophthora pseudosyringae]|uniref:Transmembrane protein n=1 Tax=Phytophthora pseudosyringae TaxID=221518 RepID=A0A8T1VFU4_9STRA|nr:hypothetical protein PHYPSEUDO_010234 [Phytophthora pseudosyringae]